VDALPYSVDVARVCGVPQGSNVALVGFGCEEELERNIGGGRRVVQEGVRLIMRFDLSAKGLYLLLCGALMSIATRRDSTADPAA
jgi:hypothetical protein